MKKGCILIGLLTFMVWALPVQAFYEDFESTGDQYSLFGGGYVEDGYLKGSGAFLDGTYPAGTAENPLIMKITFNFLGDTGTWAGAWLGFGSDGTLGWDNKGDGFILGYFPSIAYLGGATIDLLWNPDDGSVWTDVYWNPGAEEIPGGFDYNADYEMIFEDAGDTLTFWVQLASDPSITTTPVISDISGYTRFGELVSVSGGGGVGIDDITIGSPALVVEQSGGSTEVAEAGATTDSFTVALKTQPTDSVTVTVDPETADVQVNDAGPNNPITLTFTTADWDSPQGVTVQANDDAKPEGLETVKVLLSSTSNDPDFVASETVKVLVLDNDAAGVAIDEGDGVSVIEGGTTDSYTLVLGFAPTSDVTITIDDNGEPNQVTVNGSETTETTTLTFSTSDWDTPQTVTVEAIDDDEPEAHPHNTALTHSVSQPGGDNAYDGLSVSNVSVSVGENDCGVVPVDDTDYTGGPEGQPDCITNLLDFAHFVANYLNCVLAICP